jgi:lysophospholipase L1-like esterase
VVDYGTEKIKAVCDSAPLDCKFADMRDLNPPRIWDGVHPTDPGYKMLADRLWEVKKQNDIPI